MLEILLVDDETELREYVSETLREAGHRVTSASNGAEALDLIGRQVFDVAILDIHLPRVDGLTVFRRMRSQAPRTDVILVTGHGQVSDAVNALKDGAHDYLTKPFELDEIRLRVDRIAQARALANELRQAREALGERPSVSGLIGRAPAMMRVLHRVDAIAQSEAPVLVTGESGTGKELIARRLHSLSARRDKPFVAINCASFPDTLVEAELFGYERGAFTGAARRRDGRFKAAHGGTLFLDEVAELPLPAQAKLLRVLQDGTFEPLGTNQVVQVDVRIVSATHRDLKHRIAEGTFREDLYYRLNVMGVQLPPLRERRSDLPLLVEYFLHRFVREGTEPPRISPRAWAALSSYAFPGNIRELEHAIQHAVVIAGGKHEVDLDDLPAEIAPPPDVTPVHNAVPDLAQVRPLSIVMKEFEREYLARALKHMGGSRTRTAELLGISRKALWQKLKMHGLFDFPVHPSSVEMPAALPFRPRPVEIVSGQRERAVR